MAPGREADQQSLSSIGDEIQSAKNMADYEAVDVLWVALLKLANRMQGTNEHRRMLALVGVFELETVSSILGLRAVDDLLDLDPPLETVLTDPHERLEKEEAKRSLETVRQCRTTDPNAALLAMGEILKRIRNKRAHGFKRRSDARDRQILGAARSILAALCQAALGAVRKHVSQT
ncbi:hypothetical protein MYX77_00840 [Acidobacteriia bacterium AH_259_A11_L15]|nr:hypothetical protein [Acidobacteriia bacterium AH_259_A11_L15]